MDSIVRWSVRKKYLFLKAGKCLLFISLNRLAWFKVNVFLSKIGVKLAQFQQRFLKNAFKATGLI